VRNTGLPDRQAGLFPDFPVQRFFDGLAILDRAPEPGPAAWMGDPRLVVTVMQRAARPPVTISSIAARRPWAGLSVSAGSGTPTNF